MANMNIIGTEDLKDALGEAFEEGWNARAQFNHARRNTPLREDRLEERDAFVRRAMAKLMGKSVSPSLSQSSD
jgi:hypothetical protein